MKPVSLAIFASGNGSNAVRLIEHFSKSDSARVTCVVTNNPNAAIVSKARDAGVSVQLFTNAEFEGGESVSDWLLENQIDWVILAGFLRKVSPVIISAFRDRIINIHPALLPKYGGAGMYGRFVHEAVAAAQERESGITIHLVNEEFDAGEILAQERVELSEEDDASSIFMKVQQLEHRYFAEIVERVIKERSHA